MHRVKLLHSRRFGTGESSEGCSAMDVLLPSPMDAMIDTMEEGEMMMGAGGEGGYFHEFEHYQDDIPAEEDGAGSSVTPPPAAAADAGGTAPTAAPAAAIVDPFFGPAPTPAGEDGGDRTAAGSAPAPAPAGLTGDEGDRRLLGGGGRRRRPRSLQEGADGGGVPPQEFVRTRSVRLLMAGHAEPSFAAPDGGDGGGGGETGGGGLGYVVRDVSSGNYNQATVYAFAQQVDVRLPAGDVSEDEALDDVDEMQAGEYGELDYLLHEHGKEEDELAQELEKDFKVDVPKDDFLKIVTSGVESRALLNDGDNPSLTVVYPVALVADPTTKRHYYVVMLASEDPSVNDNDPRGEDGYEGVLNRDYTIGEGAAHRAWSDHGETGIEGGDPSTFGLRGRPRYGASYRIVLKKMGIEADSVDLTAAESDLSGESMDGRSVAMRHGWVQQYRPDGGEDVRATGLLFAPSGDVDGVGDVLIMVGTTAGRGTAFGTTEDVFSGSDSGSSDLDGFVTKVRADTGAYAGNAEELDETTNTFINRESKRISSIPGMVDIVSGVCARPLSPMGMVQEKMDYVYVVGSTSAVVPAVADGLRSDDYLSRYPISEGSENETMEAFLMKIDLSTMNTVWTVQVGAIAFAPESGEKFKGSALGYGCAVTRDGEDVYLTGLVKEGGVATDFSDLDVEAGVEDRRSMGGTDVFVSSYKTDDGSRTFVKQVGSTKDDYPSRGNGGITTDRLGNAVITGSTRGSMMRSRSKLEFMYGPNGEDAAMDVFIMSLDRLTSDHVPIATDTNKSPEVPPEETEDTDTETASETESSSGSDSAFGVTDTNAESATPSEDSEKSNSALVIIIAVASVFVVLSVVATAVVVRRIKKSKRDEEVGVISNGTNLHGSRRRSDNVPQRSAWGHHHANNSMKDLNPNVKVEVRNSASGGWHGVYDEDHILEFPGGGNGDIVQESLFMDEVKEIEDSAYVIGEMDNDVSDEELIKAYNEAMAVEIEPESPDVEFAMSGVGSQAVSGVGSEPKGRPLSPSDVSLNSVV